MNKKTYVENYEMPVVVIEEVQVEKGFATSGEAWGQPEDGE